MYASLKNWCNHLDCVYGVCALYALPILPSFHFRKTKMYEHLRMKLKEIIKMKKTAWEHVMDRQYVMFIFSAHTTNDFMFIVWTISTAFKDSTHTHNICVSYAQCSMFICFGNQFCSLSFTPIAHFGWFFLRWFNCGLCALWGRSKNYSHLVEMGKIK